jgi:hypothetical protein
LVVVAPVIGSVVLVVVLLASVDAGAIVESVGVVVVVEVVAEPVGIPIGSLVGAVVVVVCWVMPGAGVAGAMASWAMAAAGSNTAAAVAINRVRIDTLLFLYYRFQCVPNARLHRPVPRPAFKRSPLVAPATTGSNDPA